jgi:hypothetical protein
LAATAATIFSFSADSIMDNPLAMKALAEAGANHAPRSTARFASRIARPPLASGGGKSC